MPRPLIRDRVAINLHFRVVVVRTSTSRDVMAWSTTVRSTEAVVEVIAAGVLTAACPGRPQCSSTSLRSASANRCACSGGVDAGSSAKRKSISLYSALPRKGSIGCARSHCRKLVRYSLAKIEPFDPTDRAETALLALISRDLVSTNCEVLAWALLACMRKLIIYHSNQPEAVSSPRRSQNRRQCQP